MINRKGIVRISNEFYKDNEGFQILQEVFGKFVPLFIREDFTTKDYHGFSIFFDPIAEGEQVPFYEITVQESHDLTSNSKYCINFSRIL